MINIEKIWITDRAVWIRTVDGREACENFYDYPRLLFATQKERENYTYDDFGIRWEELDEDLCFEGFFEEKKRTQLYKLFISHPELNASVIARKLGLSQSLFVQYICGNQTPSKQLTEKILDTIRSIGQELSNI